VSRLLRQEKCGAALSQERVIMRVLMLALALLLPGLILPPSQRSAGASPPPARPDEPPFTVVPLDDDQFAIVLGTGSAATAQAAAAIKTGSTTWKVLIGKIRRPATCHLSSVSSALLSTDLCDPDTDPNCTCDESAAWTVVIGKIRRPTSCHRSSASPSLLNISLCDPDTDPNCSCDDSGAALAPVAPIEKSPVPKD
jgi:hypothetical protein